MTEPDGTTLTRRSLLRAAAIACVSSTLSREATAAPSVYPTGTTRYDPGQAFNSYVLYTGADKLTHLVDMDGQEVHRWSRQGFPAKIVDPRLVGGQKGVLGAQLSFDEGAATGLVPGRPTMFKDKTIGFVDWNGATIWEWGAGAPGGAARQHHDWELLASGNLLLLANDFHTIPAFGDRKMLDDVLLEVDKKGTIVWRWLAADHLDDLGFTPSQLKLMEQTENPDYLHMNAALTLGPNRLAHGDPRFAANNVIVSSRDASIVAIIDKQTGKVVWRLGPTLPRYDGMAGKPVPRPVDQISGQHDAQMIAEGLPGAGNILIFDDQGPSGYPQLPFNPLGGSRVIEIDPVKMEIVWEYTARKSGEPPWQFYSPFFGSAQRLPNGNTLIADATSGRLIQVTTDGDIVWEYVSPFYVKAPARPTSGRKPHAANNVYRCQAVPYEWVPSDVERGERRILPPDQAAFRVPPEPVK